MNLALSPIYPGPSRDPDYKHGAYGCQRRWSLGWRCDARRAVRIWLKQASDKLPMSSTRRRIDAHPLQLFRLVLPLMTLPRASTYASARVNEYCTPTSCFARTHHHARVRRPLSSRPRFALGAADGTGW